MRKIYLIIHKSYRDGVLEQRIAWENEVEKKLSSFIGKIISF